MAYATTAELKLRIDKISAVDDAVLTAIIAAAQRNIDRACNRPDGFEASDEIKIFTGQGKPYLLIDECVVIDSVRVKDSPTDTTYTAWLAGDWIACRGDPRSPDFNTLPYDILMVDPTGNESYFTSGFYEVRVNRQDIGWGTPTVQVWAMWGYSLVAPADIREACLMQAARWFKRFQSSMADVLASDELGTLLYRQSLDPDIKRLLVDGRYVKPVIGRR